jgi:hypothetical protein
LSIIIDSKDELNNTEKMAPHPSTAHSKGAQNE